MSKCNEQRTGNLCVSISGGRTSAYMAWWIHNNLDDVAQHLGVEMVNPIYVFANTGMEHDDTLRFLNDVDQNFGLGVVWLESYPVHGKRISSQYRVTNYENAFRNDQWLNPRHPFHAHISKYGIPNRKYVGCTRELKREPIYKYCRDTFIGAHSVAIGIREDERRRVSTKERRDVVYPLAHWNPVDKGDVQSFWDQRAWDLAIPEWLGNCVTCYKKSFKKLALAIRDAPATFDFTEGMEHRYADLFLARDRARYGNAHPRAFFRGQRTTPDLKAYCAQLEADAEDYVRESDANTCSESCEVYETEIPE